MPAIIFLLLGGVPCLNGVVAVVQLVEHLIVVQEVAGSSPVSHPNPGIRMDARIFHFAGLCRVLLDFAIDSY